MVDLEKVILVIGFKFYILEWFMVIFFDIEWEDEKWFKVMVDFCFVFKDDRWYYFFMLMNFDYVYGMGVMNLKLFVYRN